MRNLIESKGNQLVNYDWISTQRHKGILIIKNDDNSITLNGTTDSDNWFFNIGYVGGEHFQRLTPGHVILISIEQSADEKILFITLSQTAYFYSWTKNNRILTVPQTNEATFFRLTIQYAGTTVNETIRFKAVDLTLMYGAGNEPTTVEQFLTDYPEYNNYVPYPGILKNYKVLETCGQVDLSTLNWTIGQYNYLQASMNDKNCKVFPAGSFPNIEIPGYTPAKVYGGDIEEDLHFTITGTGSNQYLKIRDDYWYNFQTPETFKQHLQGVIARYELANPATYLLTEVTNA